MKNNQLSLPERQVTEILNFILEQYKVLINEEWKYDTLIDLYENINNGITRLW